MRLASAQRRSGFTLVEVLVAAGLCMLIMSVLASAFAAGIDTFSLLKSTGELNDRLAVAKDVLAGDLAQVHLEDDTGLPLRVSDVRYDLLGSNLRFDAILGRYVHPPARGFFRIIQEGPSVNEGIDPDGIPSSFATNHVLHFTVRRKPIVPSNIFLTRVPTAALTSTSVAGFNPAGTIEYPLDPLTMQPRSFGYRLQRESFGALSGTVVGTDTTFASPWAEVAYFLRPSGVSTTGPTPRPLFSLHRRPRVLAKNDFQHGPNLVSELNWVAFQQTHPGLSCAPGSKNVNGPGDIADPRNRMGGILGRRVPNAFPPATLPETVPPPFSTTNIDSIGPVGANSTDITGEDILLTNVISFEVKASWDSGSWVVAEGTPPIARTVAPPVTEFPFDDLPEIPSIPFGSTQTQGMNTIDFPTGSGNDLFRRNDGTGNLTGSIRVFDTWTAAGPFASWDRPVVPSGPTTRVPNPNAVPLPIRLKAIQIKLRIYDPKNKLTRQMTFIQDL